MFLTVVHNPWFQTAVGGLLAGAAVDIHAWYVSPTWVVDGFSWKTATKRWATGIVSAVVTKAGFGAVLG